SMELEAKGEQLPEEGLEVEITGDLALDLAAGKLAVADLSISGPQLHLTGALSIAGLGEKSRIEGSLGLQETNLKTLLALAGVELETADPEALTRVSFQLQMAQEGESLKIEPLRIKVDDTRIEGMVTLALHEPVLQARLKLDSIDLDRYRPLESEQAQVRQTVGDGGKPPPAEKVDFEPLRRLDANIVVEAERVEVSGLKLAKAKLTLKAKKGVISLDPVTALLYNGRLKASSSLDVREKQPSVQVRSELVGIRVGPLLADLTGEERLTGTGKVSFSLRTRGMKEDAVRRNLDGDFSIDFRDGAYKGFNLAQAIRQAEAAIRGTTITEDEPRQTDFAELRASGIIRKGVLSNRDLYLASPVLRVRGKGEVDLDAEKVDYRLTAKVVGTLIGQGGKPMDRLKGLVIPVQLKGDLGDPSFRIDPEALAKAVAGKKLEEQKGKVIEKIEEKLGPGLLKGLLGK
ncbi:MAG TPA: AsmA family protein, partial [Chromatiaceae bacterium]|nr:AsmA family protein [Chromatiaceae bacterium]